LRQSILNKLVLVEAVRQAVAEWMKKMKVMPDK